MKAIEVKYLPATNVRGSRIKAYDLDGNQVTISYPHELSGDDVYRAAAEELCKKMNWKGSIEGGGTKNGMVFVFTPKTDELRKSLLNLSRWATGSNKQGNPYQYGEITDAIEVLTDGKSKYDLPKV